MLQGPLADVTQLEEFLPCKQGVEGSSPFVSSGEEMSIENLKSAVTREISDVEISVDGPNAHGYYVVDFFQDAQHVVVQHTPLGGYGVSLVDETTCFGEGPDEVHPELPDAARRVIELLRNGKATS